MITRTFVQILPDPAVGTVTINAFVQIDGRWFTEPRCFDVARFAGPPAHHELEADVKEARSMGMFGTSGWWRPVPAPVLGEPTFLFPPVL